MAVPEYGPESTAVVTRPDGAYVSKIVAGWRGSPSLRQLDARAKAAVIELLARAVSKPAAATPTSACERTRTGGAGLATAALASGSVGSGLRATFAAALGLEGSAALAVLTTG